MSDILSSLEVVDVSEEQLHSIIPVKYDKPDNQWQAKEVELKGAAEPRGLQELCKEQYEVAPEEQAGQSTEEDVHLVIEVRPVRTIVEVGDCA